MTFPVLAAGTSSYRIQRSVRLRAAGTAYLTRTPATATNRTTWTWSGWVKRGAQGSIQQLFTAGSNAANRTVFGFIASDRLQFYSVLASATTATYDTSSLFRDPSAWYHIMVAFDSTQATAANRLIIYVNGVSQPIIVTSAVTLNNTLMVNSTNVHTLGRESAVASSYFDGYLTEINFIDGQQLTPTSFGETNAITGVWQPKKYTGTYGTNGFYVNFSNNSAATAAAIGADYSGNGNNWTPTNISVTAGVTYDSMVDVPTPYDDGITGRGNYAVLNPLRQNGSGTFSQGNLAGTSESVTQRGLCSTIVLNRAGKWYMEWSPASNTTNWFGVTAAAILAADINTAGQQSVLYYASTGNKYVNGTASAYGTSYTTQTIGIAFDGPAGTITFYRDNVSQGAITLPSSTVDYVFCMGNAASGGITNFANFGQRPFTYTPPTGFLALNTQNLPSSTITNGANYMAATLYTGTGATQSINNAVNGVSFQPDMVWMKSRSAATNHALYDVVRGTTKQVILTTAAETTEATGLTAFTSTGFTVGALAALNTNAATYVAWQWEAGGAAVTNTTGSITTQVSANTSAGFSVVTYTGNGVAGATIGHGLNAVPDMFVVKSLGVNNWPIYHSGNATPARDIFYLNLTNAVAINTTFWNNVLPSSSVITLGTNSHTNTNAQNYVAYCWAAVAGYSAFGSYTGNGAADGPFVYTGFRPRWIMIRYIAGVTNWLVWDTSRTTSNVMGEELYPNLTTIGTVATDLDILSNGFKIRNTTAAFNTSAGRMVYAAFAENPFKNALAR
jgi:hypothetical protein